MSFRAQRGTLLLHAALVPLAGRKAFTAEYAEIAKKKEQKYFSLRPLRPRR
jgi:hypothetical protein